MTPNQIMAIIWLVLFFGFFLAEIFTVQFVSLWFMLGALVCLGLSFIPDFPIWAQAIVFFAVSLVSLFLFRPLMKRKVLSEKRWLQQRWLCREALPPQQRNHPGGSWRNQDCRYPLFCQVFRGGAESCCRDAGRGGVDCREYLICQAVTQGGKITCPRVLSSEL
jgi:hypothetical protein